PIIAVILGAILNYIVLTRTKDKPKPEPDGEKTYFSLRQGTINIVDLTKLTKVQLRKMKDYTEQTIIDLPNTTSAPLKTVVILFPRKGIAELVHRDNRRELLDFTGRIEIPMIAPHDKKILNVWHKDRLKQDEYATVSVLGAGTLKLHPPEYITLQ